MRDNDKELKNLLAMIIKDKIGKQRALQ